VGIFIVSMAILRTLEQQIPDLSATVCSGLSLGEYTALCASGRLGFRETLLLVKERARLMHEACVNIPGTMAAVLGLAAPQIETAIQGIPGIWIANYNAKDQIVISGTKEGVDKASILLKEKGAKRVVPLTVHGAFHSGLMQPAQEGLSPFVQNAAIQSSEIDFVMNVPGNFTSSIADIRRNLISQVTQSVRWEQGISAMRDAGVEQYIEIGCGKTLTGLNRKMGLSSTLSIEKVTDLEQGAMHATT
jgi:[acyl-carrier-protein] S-malonyltransferase